MTRARLARSSSLALVLGLGAVACAGPVAPDGIVLVTLDTTRADRIGCYGYGGAVTPRLDALAAEGVRFDQATSAVSTTLASHATIFTGHYPPVHGVRYNGMFRLGPASQTVAETLRGAGWATAAFPAAFPVTAAGGLDQGFEVYRDMFREPGAETLGLTAERNAGEITDLALEWLKTVRGRKFFAWVHYFDPHVPYRAPFPWGAQFRDRPYDGEIAYTDFEVGRLVDGLKQAGVLDRTVVIVAGDHGEGLHDHGERYHANLAYQSTIHVPLIAYGAGVAGGAVVREPVSLADIAPTVLDLAGVANPEPTDGVSLAATLRDGTIPPRRALYFEALAGSLMFGWSPIEGLRRGNWKLLRSSDPELFDLEKDPGELVNALQLEPGVASELGALLDEAKGRWATRAKPVDATVTPLDAESLARLASLGYVGGEVSTSVASGPAPQSLVFLEGDIILVRDLMIDHDYRVALDSIANVLKADPGNRFALHVAITAYSALGEYGTALRLGEELTRRYPDFVPGFASLGFVHVARADFSAAEAVYRAGLSNVRDDPALVYPLALAIIAQGRPREALPLLEKATAAETASPSFDVATALCRARLGEPAAAAEALQRAVERGYRDLELLRNEPMLAPLRSLPEFAEIVARIPASAPPAGR